MKDRKQYPLSGDEHREYSTVAVDLYNEVHGERQQPTVEGRILESLIYKAQTVEQLSDRLGLPRRKVRLALGLLVLGDEVRGRPDGTFYASDLRPIG